MTDDEDRRRRRKQWQYLRDTGRPARIWPEEYAALQAHLASLVNAGMPHRQIAEQSGVAASTVSRIAQAVHSGATRKNYDKLMAVTFELPDLRGARLTDLVGLQRRVNALRGDGWPLEVLNRTLGRLGISRLRALSDGTAKYIHADPAEALKAMYAKLADVDPVDYGVPPADVKKAKSWTKAKGFAPSSCWDADTIDDPEAFPEWTGACGTDEGYTIHIRETLGGNPLPLCEPCRQAVETKKLGADKFVFDREAFAAALDEQGLNCRDLARRMWGDDFNLGRVDRLYKWRSGQSSPRSKAQVQEIAGALGVPLDSLLDLVKTEAVSTTRFGHGEFNPYVLRAALDLAGISMNAAASLPGSATSRPAIEKWLKGEYKPSGPEKLQAIADHLGVDVGVFFQ